MFYGMNSWAQILGSGMVAWALVSAAAAEDRDMSTLTGIQRVAVFTPLPAQAVGVVVLEPQPILAFQRRFGPKDVACFSSGPGSYRFFYVPAKGKGNNVTQSFSTGAPGGEKISIGGLTLATVGLLKPEITEPYTLVRVVINRGAGCGSDGIFAATDLKTLGPSEGYKVRVSETVRDRQAQYRSDQLPGLLRDELAKAERELEPLLLGAGPRVERRSDEQTLTHVTWLTDKSRLHVCFLTIRREGKYLKGRGTEPRRNPRPGADLRAAHDTAGDETGRYGVVYQIETGWVYEFSAEGEETRNQPLKATGKVITLNPPASTGPPRPRPARGPTPPGPSGAG
jgi:hypothetical protein